jgi:hypothetical protein
MPGDLLVEVRAVWLDDTALPREVSRLVGAGTCAAPWQRTSVPSTRRTGGVPMP